MQSCLHKLELWRDIAFIECELGLEPLRDYIIMIIFAFLASIIVNMQQWYVILKWFCVLYLIFRQLLLFLAINFRLLIRIRAYTDRDYALGSQKWIEIKLYFPIHICKPRWFFNNFNIYINWTISIRKLLNASNFDKICEYVI